MINTEAIKGRMREMGVSQAALAEEMGLASSTVCQKINNIRTLSLAEAEKIGEILKVKDEEWCDIFFN